jgi:hypothetical protein
MRWNLRDFGVRTTGKNSFLLSSLFNLKEN